VIYHTQVCANFDCDVQMQAPDYARYTEVDTDASRAVEEQLYDIADAHVWIYRVYELTDSR